MDTTPDYTVIANPNHHSIYTIIHPATGLNAYTGETIEETLRRFNDPEARVMPMKEWQRLQAARQDTPIEWEPISEDAYNEMFEVLPPADYRDHYFLVGEPSDHHAMTGEPRYQACKKTADGFFASSRPMTVREFNS